jgi:hypothetical protein
MRGVTPPLPLTCSCCGGVPLEHSAYALSSLLTVVFCGLEPRSASSQILVG